MIKIITILKQVPDLVEELELNNEGTALDKQWLKFILSEYDDHALEQSLIIKEKLGANVKAIALDLGEATESLITASAKGADELLLLKGDFPEDISNHLIAKIYHTILSSQQFDLILTGVQAIDDFDGSIGPILAGIMELPYVGVVKGIQFSEDQKSIIVGKEYPGGLISKISVRLPAIIGIQAAELPPRYVPIAKIRQAQKTAKIEELNVNDTINKVIVDANKTKLKIKRMFKPDSITKAEILDGNINEVVNRLLSLLAQKGLMR